YVADEGPAKEVFGFRVNKSNAALIPLPFSPFASGADTNTGLAIAGKPLLFSLGHVLGGGLDLQAFLKVSRGVLVAHGVSTSAGIGPLASGALEPQGRFLVVASNTKVRSFAVNSTTAGLTTVDTETIAAGSVTHLLIVKR